MSMGMGKNSRAVDKFSRFMTDHRLIILVAMVVILGVFAYGATRIRGEVILQDMLPYNHPYLKLMARFSEVFGSGGSGVAIAVKAKNGDIFNEKTLDKIQKITNEIEMWDEVYRILTVSIASRSVKKVNAKQRGEVKIEPLMWPEIPRNKDEIEELKKSIFSSPAYNGTLVSQDGTAALILTEFKENISYKRSFELLKGIVSKYQDSDVSIHLVGYPVLMGWIYSYKTQIMLVFALSVALMIGLLYMIFLNVAGMFTPLSFGLFVAALGLGFIGFTGVNFSPLLYVLAFLVGARIVSHSVQITHRYFEEFLAHGGDRTEACYQTMRKMIVPNVAAVATEVAGFLTLFLAKIALMQQVAIIMSFWMACIALAGIATPILCSYMPMIGNASKEWSSNQSKVDWLARLCTGSARFCTGSGRYVVIAGCLIIVIFGLFEAGRLKIGDPTPGSPLLFPNHPYNQDQQLINTTFTASSENLMLFFEGTEGSVYDPEVLMTFEGFERHMKSKVPDIYKSSSSIISTVKMVNVTLHDGDTLWYQLPRNSELLYGLMGYVKANTDIGTLSRFLDRTLERAQTTLFFSDHTSENLLRIRDASYDYFKTRPMKIDKGEFKLAGGRVGMEIAVNEEMKRSHALIDGVVLLAIFILCTLTYRSIVAGLMLTIPLILANLVAFTYMSMMNIGLSINTLPIAAVSVGVGVDFAIFLYSRCRDEFSEENGWYNTIVTSVRTCGKAIVYTGLTTILPIIMWYFISDMKFQAQMGIFLSLIMGVNVILALTLHPLLIYVIKPRFISKGARLYDQPGRASEEAVKPGLEGA
ncbi:MAG: transporter [Deltaproteobacteria bacterium]|nr:transporter [Deltaproteobacteria bacterium]